MIRSDQAPAHPSPVNPPREAQPLALSPPPSPPSQSHYSSLSHSHMLPRDSSDSRRPISECLACGRSLLCLLASTDPTDLNQAQQAAGLGGSNSSAKRSRFSVAQARLLPRQDWQPPSSASASSALPNRCRRSRRAGCLGLTTVRTLLRCLLTSSHSLLQLLQTLRPGDLTSAGLTPRPGTAHPRSACPQSNATASTTRVGTRTHFSCLSRHPPRTCSTLPSNGVRCYPTASGRRRSTRSVTPARLPSLRRARTSRLSFDPRLFLGSG